MPSREIVITNVYLVSTPALNPEEQGLFVDEASNEFHRSLTAFTAATTKYVSHIGIRCNYPLPVHVFLFSICR